MAQYHYLQPYSCLSLPQLDLGREFHALATQGDPILAPKQPAIRPNQKSFSPLPNTWLVRDTLSPVSPPKTVFLSQPTSAGPRRKSHLPATQVDPIRAPKQTAIHPNQHFFFFAKYIASKRLFGPVSPPKTLSLSQPTSAEPRDESHPSATL